MDRLAPLVIAVPLVAALVLRVTPTRMPRWIGDTAAVATALATAGIAVALLGASRDGTLVHWVGGWQPVDGAAIGIPLVADPISAGLCALTAVATAVALLTTWGHAETVDDRSHALGLTFLAGVCGFTLAGDVLTLFVFLELTSITAYVLTGYRAEETGALQGAIVFAITNTVAATLFLAGGTVLYATAGTPNLAEIGQVITDTGPTGPVVVALTLLTAGLAAKAALLPFHFWHADSHTVAPAWAAALFSGVLIQVAVYGLGRVYLTAFPSLLVDHGAELRAFLLVVGVATAAVAGLFCVLQDDLKRLLAFSTLAHVGIVTIGLATFEPDGVAGAATYVVGHAAVKSALFLLAGLLVHRFGTASTSSLHGRLREAPAIAGLLVVGALALAGLPPAGLYTGKVLLGEAVGAVGYDWASYVVLATGAVTAAAVLRATGAMTFGWGGRRPFAPGGTVAEPQEGPPGLRSPGIGAVVLVPVAALLLGAAVIGPLPGFVAGAQEAGGRFVDDGAYVAAVLDGARPTTPEPAPEPLFTASSLRDATVVGVAAFALAGLGWWSTTRPVPVILDRAVRRLRRVHSGHVGDYLVWQLVGTTGIGLCLTVLLR